MVCLTVVTAINPYSGTVCDLTIEIRCLDKMGLLLKSDGDDLTPAQTPFAREQSDWSSSQRDLFSIVQQIKPHVLIGTSTKPKAFTEEIIREMAKHVERPIIFPLSNPTRLHEAKPQDLYEWTDGKALIATGSPFPPVKYGGVEYEIGKSISRGGPVLELIIFKPNAIILLASRESVLEQFSHEAALYVRRCSWRLPRLSRPNHLH